jgi:hypothetical protein
VLKRFLLWIEEYMSSVGIISLAGSVIGVLAFGGVLSALIGSTAIKAGMLVAVILTVIIFYGVLLASLRASFRQNTANKRLLAHYCSILKETLDYALHISYWDQVAIVEKNGDTRENVTIHATVDCKELYFFRLRFGPAWSQPEKYLKRVTVNVRTVLLDGVGGTRWDVTTSPLTDGRLELLAHFHAPAPRGTDIRITLDWVWPGKCIPLMRYREPDVFKVHFTQLIEYVRYSVVLPGGEDAFFDPVGFDATNKDYTITSAKNSQGNAEVVFSGRNVPPDQRVGMRLDLK